MHAVRTLVAFSVATLASACANTGGTSAAPPSAGMAPITMGAPGSMATMEPRMKAMQDMHQKMVNSSTPAERQALMADHMKAMQGGMAMMKEMHGMHAGSGMGMGSSGGGAPMAGMGDGMGMPGDMAKRHQMMADHMAMMQMMMDMMADRMPPAPMGK